MIAIIGLLMALLLPALQAARESTRRTHCGNNLKQVGLALQGHHAAHERFPQGAIYGPPDGPPGAYSHSWWIRILPYLEHQSMFDRFDHTGATASGHSSFSNNANVALFGNQPLSMAICPSSPLPSLQPSWNANYKTPQTSYVAVSGSVNPPTAVTWSHNGYSASDIVSRGGVMPHDRARTVGHIRDGASNTMAVAEQADWCTNASGARSDCRSTGRSLFYGFFRDYNPRLYNLSTVRHPLNTKSSAATGVSGSGAWQLNNNPLQSAHAGGVMALFADGSTHFLNENLDIGIVFNLSDVNDGKIIPDLD